MARGDSFDPPVFCNICRFEMFEATPHVCDIPIEGTPAWYDPRYEQRHMATRSQHLNENVGDVTAEKFKKLQAEVRAAKAGNFGQIPDGLLRRAQAARMASISNDDVVARAYQEKLRGGVYNPNTAGGKKIDADHLDSMRAYYTGSTVGPSNDQRVRVPIRHNSAKVEVTMKRDEPREPIPLGPAPKPMGELTTHTMPTMEDFERMVEEWHSGPSSLTLHEYMGITWDEYGCVFLSRFYHPLHGRR